MDEKLFMAKRAVAEATQRFESADRKLRKLRGRIKALRTELSQIEPKLPILEENLTRSRESLAAAQAAFRPLKPEWKRQRREDRSAGAGRRVC